MKKLVYLGLWVGPLILAIRASGDASPRAGLRRTVTWTLVLTVAWAIFGPWLSSLSE